MTLSRRGLVALGAGAIVAATPVRRPRAAPAAKLWRRWAAHDPSSTRRVNHDAWSAVLGSHARMSADGVVRVDYAGIADHGRAALSAYVDMLAAVQVDALSRPEQMAFWFNLYNAVTMRTVVDHYPVPSIRDIDISPGLFADGPWGKQLVTVAGQAVSLDDIEHRILRPIWRDPLIHYAVNCAALGCPNLVLRAFDGANVEAMLAAAATAFVNHRRGVRFDGRRLIVSSLYRWYGDDFGDGDEAVIRHLRRYAMPALAARLDDARRIAGDQYDWALNDAR